MKRLIALGALLLVATSTAFPQQRLFSFQGYIEDEGVPVTGNHTLIFTLWSQPTNGTNGWTETHANVPVEKGVFSVLLGGTVSLESVDFLVHRYLSVTVDGHAITPRTEIASAPSALTVVTPLSLSTTWSTGHTLKVENLATTGPSFGVIGEANSTGGIGVYGESTPTGMSGGLGVGGVSRATSGASAGVYGSGPYGVWGESEYGPAVYGRTWSTVSAPVGVLGEAGAQFGTGVRGSATNTSGANRGIDGRTNSPDGYGGYFTGGTAVYARAYDNGTPDIVAGANSGTNDNGWLSSDPAYNSSDLVLTSQDDINIQLDRNNDEDGVLWISANGGTTSIFQVEEDGDVRVNGSLVHSSDRAAKEHFEKVDPQEILDLLAGVPVLKWNYLGKDATHLGPIAQDFMQAFSLGEDETGIATVDADGVAMAAIQGLYQVVLQLQARVEELEQANRDAATK